MTVNTTVVTTVVIEDLDVLVDFGTMTDDQIALYFDVAIEDLQNLNLVNISNVNSKY